MEEVMSSHKKAFSLSTNATTGQTSKKIKARWTEADMKRVNINDLALNSVNEGLFLVLFYFAQSCCVLQDRSSTNCCQLLCHYCG